MRQIWPVAALCLAAAFAGMQASRADVTDSTSAQNLDALRARLKEGTDFLQNSDDKDAKARLDAVVSDPLFAWLSAEEKFTAELSLGYADYNLQDYAGAEQALKSVTASPYATGEFWALRCVAAYRARDLDDAVLSLDTVAKNWPASLEHVSDQTVYVLSRAKTNSDHRAGMLEGLYAAKWTPRENTFVTPDPVFLQLVLVRLEKGDEKGAEQLALAITDAATLAHMVIDKRFDPVVKAQPEHFDIARAVQQNVDDMRARSAAAPDRLAGVNALAAALMAANRPEEALTILDNANAQLKADANGKTRFFVDPDNANWLGDMRSNALRRLGRSDDSNSAMAGAAQQKEDGRLNVSQAINLAQSYDDLGEPKEALAALALVSDSAPSPYGRMQLELDRACAYAQLNDAANLASALDYLKAHTADATEAYRSALLCANELDAAAAAFIAELDDPFARNDALFRLQHFGVSSPSPAPPEKESAPAPQDFWDVVLARRRTMLARPDVAAAIEKYGRIISLPIEPL